MHINFHIKLRFFYKKFLDDNKYTDKNSMDILIWKSIFSLEISCRFWNEVVYKIFWGKQPHILIFLQPEVVENTLTAILKLFLKYAEDDFYDIAHGLEKTRSLV